MLRKHKCGGDCESCRRGCGNGRIRSENRAMTENGSDLGDIQKLGEYLSERYSARSLITEIRNVYDPNYLALFGVEGAMVSYLTHFRDSLGLRIEMEDIEKMAAAIIEKGDIVY